MRGEEQTRFSNGRRFPFHSIDWSSIGITIGLRCPLVALQKWWSSLSPWRRYTMSREHLRWKWADSVITSVIKEDLKRFRWPAPRCNNSGSYGEVISLPLPHDPIFTSVKIEVLGLWNAPVGECWSDNWTLLWCRSVEVHCGSIWRLWESIEMARQSIGG